MKGTDVLLLRKLRDRCDSLRNLGIVRGITVRSRSIVGNFLGGLQTLFGGNITI
jgi:uncharacterized protein YbjQ (UPF0145 family)